MIGKQSKAYGYMRNLKEEIVDFIPFYYLFFANNKTH